MIYIKSSPSHPFRPLPISTRFLIHSFTHSFIISASSLHPPADLPSISTIACPLCGCSCDPPIRHSAQAHEQIEKANNRIRPRVIPVGFPTRPRTCTNKTGGERRAPRAAVAGLASRTISKLLALTNSRRYWPPRRIAPVRAASLDQQGCSILFSDWRRLTNRRFCSSSSYLIWSHPTQTGPR